MMDKSIFEITGGIGKHIAASAMLEAYKKHHPNDDIIVVCAWPEVFLHNPTVSRVFKLGNAPYFYQDYIYKTDNKIFAQDPYKQTSHILKKTTLIETWCDLVGVPCNGESPKLYFNHREYEIASTLIPKTDKPILLFQPFGGPGSGMQDTEYSWMRDIHPEIAQILVNELSKTYQVVHVCYNMHPVLQNCVRMDLFLQKKVLFALLMISSKRLLIDSSLQHAAAALGLPSTVQWVATQPEVFGYNIHDNIKANVEFPEGSIDSYLYDYNFTGAIYECPYGSPYQIFNIEKILNSISNDK